MVVGGGVRVRECARVCMHAYVRDVFAIYDNDILPMLLMIIINIIILYFIQIRHTDDFPSTGTGLVYGNDSYSSLSKGLCKVNKIAKIQN